ncbi:MAG TPA: TetR/AcrR family transcriptional regulator [Anaeromyxobacteraceae bacterium]|nr:TetR/AcrR family transcriptional regulator [Anaeromyxobacteraceae bacterium]
MAVAARSSELSPQKRRQILAGARAIFAELGYERASVDRVAAHAGVSKATIYNHFADKKALFVACFSEEADALRDELRNSLGDPEGDLRLGLARGGEKLVGILLSPAIVCLYRHTIAEAGRFPEVGETLFERGPAVVYAAVSTWLRRWAERGALRLDDTRAAAVQFVMLCQGDLVIRAQLGVEPTPSAAELRATVRRAVEAFVRAYGA